MKCPDCGATVSLAEGETVTVGDLSLSPDRGELDRAGTTIALTPSQVALMRVFMEHPRQVLAPSQLYEQIWGYDLGETSNALRVAIGALRRKLGEPCALKTVYGFGYMLEVSAS